MAEYHIMVGDLGGTNLRYSLYRSTPSSDTEIKSESFNSRDFRHNESIEDPNSSSQNLITSMQMFLRNLPTPEIIVLAIAGVVRDNNLVASCAFGTWLTHSEISEKLGIKIVVLLNDLQGTGYGVLTLLPTEYKEINHVDPSTYSKTAVKACGSLGTGVGQCYLVKSQYYQALASEGGFIDFSPRLEEDRYLFQFGQEYRDSISLGYSSFISGNGIPLIYEWVKHSYPELLNTEIDLKINTSHESQSKLILESGYQGLCEVCKKTCQVWERIVGYFLSNMFATYLPYGGIYLAGGVISKNFENFNSSGTATEGFYLGKGEVLHEEMRRVPIFIVKAADLALRGCLLHAKQLVFD